MKKMLSFLLALCIMVSIAVTATVSSSAASVEKTLATNEYGYFLVSSDEDFITMCNMVNSGEEAYARATYLLTNDIECEEYWNTPIGNASTPFRGNFDGQGHTIKLDAYGNGDTYTTGLFGKIQNAAIANVVINHQSGGYRYNECRANYFGGVCGISEKSVITNCHVRGCMSPCCSEGWGGIAGYASDTIISNCTVSGSMLHFISSKAPARICPENGSTTIVNNAFYASVRTYNLPPVNPKV